MTGHPVFLDVWFRQSDPAARQLALQVVMVWVFQLRALMVWSLECCMLDLGIKPGNLHHRATMLFYCYLCFPSLPVLCFADSVPLAVFGLPFSLADLDFGPFVYQLWTV